VMGIPTGLKNFDHHFGGWLPSRVTTFLGRPGDAKSFTLSYFTVQGFLDDRRVGVFSPEMDKHAHWARVHTLLSAERPIQEEVGLKNAFRNRALMEGHGFNEKTYRKFLMHLDERKGEIILFTKAWRRMKLSPAFIESKIEDLGLEMVIVDPIYLLRPERRRQLKHEEIQDMMEQMEGMAQAFQIPVLVSNQAHRQMGNKGDAPTKDQSFASDAPTQISDHIVGVKHSEEEQKIIMRCTKNRYGANFRCEVRFRPNIGTFEDVTPLTGNYFNGHVEGHDEEIKEALEEAAGVEADA
jgi:replicative DNA helicase